MVGIGCEDNWVYVCWFRVMEGEGNVVKVGEVAEVRGDCGVGVIMWTFIGC